MQQRRDELPEGRSERSQSSHDRQRTSTRWRERESRTRDDRCGTVGPTKSTNRCSPCEPRSHCPRRGRPTPRRDAGKQTSSRLDGARSGKRSSRAPALRSPCVAGNRPKRPQPGSARLTFETAAFKLRRDPRHPTAPRLHAASQSRSKTRWRGPALTGGRIRHRSPARPGCRAATSPVAAQSRRHRPSPAGVPGLHLPSDPARRRRCARRAGVRLTIAHSASRGESVRLAPGLSRDASERQRSGSRDRRCHRAPLVTHTALASRPRRHERWRAGRIGRADRRARHAAPKRRTGRQTSRRRAPSVRARQRGRVPHPAGSR